MPFHSFNSPVAGAPKLCTAVIFRETRIIHLSTLSFGFGLLLIWCPEHCEYSAINVFDKVMHAGFMTS